MLDSVFEEFKHLYYDLLGLQILLKIQNGFGAQTDKIKRRLFKH